MGTVGRTIKSSISVSILLAVGLPAAFAQSQRPLAADVPTVFPSVAPAASLSARIQALVSGPAMTMIGNARANVTGANNLYKLRGHQPMFVTANGPNALAQQLKDVLTRQAATKGFEASLYWTPAHESRWSQRDANSLVELEVLMAVSLVQFASDISTGRITPAELDGEIDFVKRNFSDYRSLNTIANSGADLLSSLESLEPQHQEYKSLQTFMARLIEIQSRGGWPRLRAAATLRPGARSSDVPLIRDRLIDFGILAESERSNRSDIYDATLREAVVVFQENMKLSSDGVVGPRGFAALNTTVESRIQQVRVNLEKWRWLPTQLGERYIFVNAARQELEVIENGSPVLSMKTVNGRQLRRTPTMTDRMTNIILNPTWTAPTSIVLKDILPAQRSNANHLYEQRIRLFEPGSGAEVPIESVDFSRFISVAPPYLFRQDPGPHNSLGAVKFNLTNNRAIYLHDTNHQEHWGLVDRLYSSGCIRVERPMDLLQYVLRENPEWSPELVQATVAQPQLQTALQVRLARPIPVYIAYMTVSFDQNGRVRFSPDYYGQDSRIIRSMGGN